MRATPDRAGAAASLLLLTIACGGKPPEGCGSLRWGPEAGEASVVLVVGDTTRRDVPSAYGGRAHTPTLEALAADGILWERAYAQAPWTKPSVATLFTGLYPSQHGAHTHPRMPRRGAPRAEDRPPLQTDVLSPELTTLAEAYRAAGFRTAAFVSNPWLAEGFGFEQGFEVYEDSFARWDAAGALVSLAAIRWLESLGPDERFFLYLHYLDPHQPYGPIDRERVLALREELERDPRPLPEDAAQVVRSSARLRGGGSALELGIRPSLALLELAYRAGVERFDQALGAAVDALDARGGRATAIVVTSDHGESLYAHGFGRHGTSLYEDEIAVPLVMRLPGVHARGVRNDCLLGLVDLMPFLCRYSSLRCPDDMAGRDRLGEAVPAVAEFALSEGVAGAPGHRSIVSGRHKLIWEPQHPERQLRPPYLYFDLQRDPGEHTNLYREGVDPDPQLERLMDELAAAIPGPSANPAQQRAIGAELRERLEELGYVE